MKTTVKLFTIEILAALFLIVGTSFSATAVEKKASSHETTENSLQLEAWMTEDVYWNTNTFNLADSMVETESVMEMENWMTNENTWNVNLEFAVETESALEVEEWMTDSEVLNYHEKEVEEALEVEAWMVDRKVWK